jgi:hypothetical protein
MSCSSNSPIRRIFAIAALLLAAAAPALAATKPQEIAGSIRSAQPYGTGTLGWFVLTAYDIALWTDAKQWSYQSPFALALTYHMSFSSSDIVDRSLEEEKHDNPSISDATLATYRAMMAGLFPDVKSGDTIIGLYTPGGTVRIFHNGRLTGQVGDQAFAEAFFGIWLSANSSEPRLRAQLLHMP